MRNRVNNNDDLGPYVNDKDKKQVLSDTKDILDWLDKNPNATAKDVDNQKKKLEKSIPIIIKSQKRKDLENKLKELKNRMKNDDNVLNNLTNDEKKNQLIKKLMIWINF